MSTFTKFKMQEFCLQTIEELGFQTNSNSRTSNSFSV